MWDTGPANAVRAVDCVPWIGPEGKPLDVAQTGRAAFPAPMDANGQHPGRSHPWNAARAAAETTTSNIAARSMSPMSLGQQDRGAEYDRAASLTAQQHNAEDVLRPGTLAFRCQVYELQQQSQLSPQELASQREECQYARNEQLSNWYRCAVRYSPESPDQRLLRMFVMDAREARAQAAPKN